MSKFKVGDRVIITESVYMTERTVGAKGTIVAIDEYGNELVKLDKDIGSYNYAYTHSYTSEREDLVVIDNRFAYEIELIK